jgi:hypothetical protein
MPATASSGLFGGIDFIFLAAYMVITTFKR